MALTGQQFELLHQAFLDAFNPSGFEQMLLAKTGTNLWSIARVNGNFTDITFDVLNHFAQKGRLRELLDGATALIHSTRLWHRSCVTRRRGIWIHRSK